MSKKPDTRSVFRDLKDFQMATVDYACERLFSGKDPARRFLVADEVGLGKTLVARGVIARCIDHLWESRKRINIVYICSNEDIAAQNLDRLKIPGCEISAQSTRLTLLPLHLQNFKKSGVNLIALTPGTAFEQGKSGGRWDERMLLFWLLRRAWGIRASAATLHFLRHDKGFERFEERVINDPRQHHIHPGLAKKFVSALEVNIRKDRARSIPDLKSRFEKLRERFRKPKVDDTTRSERKRWLTDIRRVLAESCIEVLEPDLVILDEFQRFKHLLEEDNPAGDLAKQLFDSSAGLGAWVLLLSATPYRTLTLHQEEDADHHAEFVRLLRFLEDGDESFALPEVASYRDALLLAAPFGERQDLMDAKQKLESRLRRVMARTEKAGATGKDGMVADTSVSPRLEENDLVAYLETRTMAEILGEGDVIEFWKSSPFLFNFMDDYALKKAFKAACGNRELVKAVQGAKTALLDVERFQSFREVAIPNPRLRDLRDRTIGRGMWRMLWMPPTMPYHKLEGPFAAPDIQGVTKQLVFSAWHVVPKTVAAILSHEAEREMIRARRPKAEISEDEWREQSRLLRFQITRGKPASMPLLLFVYPCRVLARECDPLEAAREGTLSAPAVKRRFRQKIRELLVRLKVRYDSSGATDPRWYWLVPFLLDHAEAGSVPKEWWGNPQLYQSWLGKSGIETEEAWRIHISLAREILEGVLDSQIRLGRQPADLFDVLAYAAAAAPAITSLRAFGRAGTFDVGVPSEVSQCCTKIALSFLRLFGHPEVSDMIRAERHTGPYWKRVLAYSHGGCLQAVMDEYFHMLESPGMDSQPAAKRAERIARQVADVIGLQAAVNQFEAIDTTPQNRRVKIEAGSARLRFAMRFGDDKHHSEDDGHSASGKSRKERVRAAFNSPFWPFVLTSTSAGQEGLDFHCYCHAVTHWNLPANPVDLEQREGRVHRYKGHAIRKNVVARFTRQALRAKAPDPWNELFEIASSKKPSGASDLVPFWVFEGPSKIERHIPALPHSRDAARIGALRRALVIYRMVFGQNRQEDLLEFLLSEVSESEQEALTRDLQIDLQPPHG